MKKINVTLAGGGFHDVPDMHLEIDACRYLSHEKIEKTFSRPDLHPRQEAWLNDYEFDKVAKHFCGIGGCKCGSVPRAILYDPNGLSGLGADGKNVRALFAELGISLSRRLWAFCVE